MKETSIIILVLIAACIALFAYNELTGGEVEDVITTNIAKDQIIEARIPATQAATTADTVEAATEVKYISLENETVGKVLNITEVKTTTGTNETITARYVIMQDLETDSKVCFELNDKVELQKKGEILKPESIGEGAYIRTIPV